MHAVPEPPVGGRQAGGLVEGVLQGHEHGAVFFRYFFCHFGALKALAMEVFPPVGDLLGGAGGAGFQHEGLQYHELYVRQGGFDLLEQQVVNHKVLVRVHAVMAAYLVPHVVYAYQYGQHVGLQVDYVPLDAGVHVHHPVAAHGAVDHVVHAGIVHAQPALHERRIPGAGVYVVVAVAAGVGYGVALKQYPGHDILLTVW